MQRKLLPLLLLLVTFFNIYAQPNYTSANFGVAGDSLFYTKVLLDTNYGYNFAHAGNNINWNFSSFTPYSQFNFDFLSPVTAGYRNAFIAKCVGSGGTGAACNTQFNTLTNVAFRSLDSIKISGYTFDNLVAHDFKTNASLTTNIIGMTVRVGNVNIPLAITYTSPDVVYKFPITNGNRDSSFSSYLIDLTSSGVNFIYHVHSKRVNHADAWGSLTSPYATYASTIRLRTTILHTDTLFYNSSVIPITPYTSFEYSWFDPAYKAPVFTVSGNIVGNNEKYKTVTYLDTIMCLAPHAVSHHSPLNPTINTGTGSVTVNFNNFSTNANSYHWNFGDPSSGNLNTSVATNPTHTYHASGFDTVTFIACNTICVPEKCDTSVFRIHIYDSTQVHAVFVALPSTTCLGDTIKFNNTSVNATSYYWNFGDQTSSTVQSPQHVYTQTGTYQVTLIASNGTGTDTARHNVHIQAPPSPLISSTGPLTFCNGDSVTLYATGGTVYHWSTGQLGGSIKVKVSGSYSVTATNSCSSATAGPVVVTVNTPVDTITALGSTALCQGDSVKLQANTGSGFIYKWKRNGQVIIGATLSYYYAKQNGNYVVNITQSGCVGVSNSIAVTVNPVPTAVLSTQGSTVICSGDSLRLLVTVGVGYTYQWQLNASNIAGVTGATYYAKVAGNYTVVVTHNGCSKTSNGITLTVNTTPVPVITHSGGNTICSGDSIQLSTGAVTGYTYQWKLNGLTINGAISSYYYTSTAGLYRVAVSNNSCTGTSAATIITVNPSPVADAGIDKSLTACSFASVIIGGTPTASGGTIPYNYSWTPVSGLSSSTVSNPSVNQIGSATLYHINVTDANGCKATDSMTVNVAASGLSVTVTAQGFRSWCFGSGDSVIFTAVPSGGTGTYIYNWSPANDLSSTNTAATTAKPTAVGLYSYSVLVTDGNGCQVSAPAPVTVFALPVATITALDTTAPCAGDSVHLAASPGSGYTYQWKLNGNNVTGAVDINYTTADAGTYTAVVTNIICSTTSNSIPVTVRPLPSAAIAAQGSLVFCEGGNDLLLASIGTGYSYQWTENGLAINGAGLARYTAQDSGSYYCNITLNGCTVQSNPLLVTVLPNPLDLVTVTGATDFCAGDSVLLSVSTGTGYVYQWQKDGTVISSATADSYNATATGLYSVAVSLSSCSVISLGVPVTVNPYPSATVTANGSTTFCTGDSVTLNASTGTGYNYQWFNGTDTLTDALAPSIVVVDSGMYYVNVSSNGCVSISNTVTVEALPLPDAFITQAGQTLTASPGATYQWYNGNTLITGATQQSYTPSAAGNYSVMVTDANGCAQESAPYSFNALGISILTQDQSFSIYPNPIETENWNLDVSNGLIGTDAEVFDQSGKLIYKTVIQNLHSEIDLKIATGVYFLKINSQGTFMMKKLIKL